MKNIPLILLITISLCFVISCNSKPPYPIAAVTVSYPNLSTSAELKAVRTDRNNISVIIDTISLGLLDSYNENSAIIPFNDYYVIPNFIIYVENTSYIDTISDIMFDRNRKDKIINFEYKFNGQKKTDSEIIIR